ncbi:MAG TPA: aldose epimerase [Acidobacteriaceae bacterium]|jgi:galactose mutarotase-like enzyme|nr:aldose epimerase [Acidobacteriaceae bacterium]
MTESLTRVVLENESVRAVILPELGGKIASILIKRTGLELLQQPLHPYGKRAWAQDFAASDASGWDECLPTVSACEVSVGSEPKQLPDHGDVWLLPANCSADATEINLETTLVSMPLHLHRQIILAGSSLHIRYELRNDAPFAVPYLWSAHPLFTVEAGDRIVLPGDVRTLRVEGSAEHRLGKHNDLCSWPIAQDRDGRNADLRIVQGTETAIAEKLFTGPLPHGWCGLYRTQQQAGVLLSFAPERVPFLGLWLCYGGWPSNSAQKQHAVALEPCMVPVDSLAEALVTGCASTLAAQEAFVWQMQLTIAGADKGLSFEEFAELSPTATVSAE